MDAWTMASKKLIGRVPKLNAAYVMTHVKSGNFYIGSSGDILRRRYQHLSCLKRHRHPNAWLQKLYDDDPSFHFTFLITEDRADAYVAEKNLYEEHRENPQCVNYLDHIKIPLDKIAQKRPVSINGRRYETLTEAAQILQLNMEELIRRLDSRMQQWSRWRRIGK